MKYYEGILNSVLESVGETSGGRDIIYKCPFCESSTGSGHLYINYDKNMFHCYKCDVGGRDISKLLSMLGISLSEEIPTSISNRESNSVRLSELLRESDKKHEIITRDLDRVTEFFIAHTMNLSQGAIDYLHKRGVTDEEMLVYNMREGMNRRGTYICNTRGQDYSGRILVPSMIGDKVSYYVARLYQGVSNRKYLNPPSDIAYSSEDVWNLDRAKKVSNTVIICEGVFTAIAAGRGKYNAVATYGKSIAEISNRDKGYLSQGEQLLQAGFSKYVVAYDADARKELLSTCKYLSSRGADTYFIKVPDKYGAHTDISDLTREEYIDLLSHMEHYSKASQLDLIL